MGVNYCHSRAIVQIRHFKTPYKSISQNRGGRIFPEAVPLVFVSTLVTCAVPLVVMVIWWVRTYHLSLSHAASPVHSPRLFLSWCIAKNGAELSASGICQVQVSVRRMGLFWEFSLDLLLLSLELDWQDKQGLFWASEGLNSDLPWPTEGERVTCLWGLRICFLNTQSAMLILNHNSVWGFLSCFVGILN